MNCRRFQMPTKQGKFTTISNEDFKKLEFYSYGIYRCTIDEDHKLFKRNKSGYYTHYDLTLCKILNLKVEIVEDGSANCLLYDGQSRICGNRVFGGYATYMFDLKKRGLPVKCIIYSLWGMCCQKQYSYVSASNNDTLEIDDPNVIIKDLWNENKMTAKVYSMNEIFLTNYARIGPFLTSFCRLQIAKIALPHLKHVVK